MAENRKIDDGGPAFPVELQIHDGQAIGGVQTSQYSGWATGMSLRDYFAIHAAWEDVRHYAVDGRGINISRTKARYIYADAMIAARKEK